MKFIDAYGDEIPLPTTYLSYNDILLVPQYSEIESRQDGSISTKVTMGNLQLDIPFISANMDTVTEFNTANVMSKNGGLGALHRFWQDEDLYLNEISECAMYHKNICFSVGCSTPDSFIDKAINGIIQYENKLSSTAVLVDVAHGHMKKTLDYVSKLKKMLPNEVTIIAGNVATPEGFDALVESGADVVKVGVGNGCFVGNTLITTKEGTKFIQDIEIGDVVLTHTESYKEVIALFVKQAEELIDIEYNGKKITCTPNHEIYVIHEKNIEYTSNDNYQKYAEWIPASNLTDEYYVIEI